MAGLKRFKYTGKEHKSIVDECISKIKEVYGSDCWNDFEEDNAGIMLIETFAYVADLLLFYLDRQANETYLPTATERQNLINMCKLIGYTPKSAKPAQAEITVSIDSVHGSDVTLPEGSLLETNDGITFETLNDAVIPAGQLSVNVQAVEGETFSEITGTSDGQAWQEFYLPRSGVIEILGADIDGHSWTVTDTLADKSENDEVFTADIDAWRRAEISFGDGRTGKIPLEGERITVRYRIGGGIAGNVAPDTITSVRDIATDTAGKKISVHVTNKDWASGGSEPESIESIKLWAPRFFETQNRCVTQQDYETFATNFNGICKAKAVVCERSGEANVIRLYVLTYGADNNTVAIPNQTLKDNLLDYLNKYKMLTDWLEIEDGIIKPVNFSGTVTIAEGFIKSLVLKNISDALNNFMNVDIRDMGEPLRISDLYALIDNANFCQGIMEHLRAANTIWPTNISEFEERRLEMDRVLVSCNKLQDELQYIAETLPTDKNKFMNHEYCA